MEVTTEICQQKEIELRERARRIQKIESRIKMQSPWDVAIEIEDLNRKILELETKPLT